MVKSLIPIQRPRVRFPVAVNSFLQLFSSFIYILLIKLVLYLHVLYRSFNLIVIYLLYIKLFNRYYTQCLLYDV